MRALFGSMALVSFYYRIALPERHRELGEVRTARIAAPSASDHEHFGAHANLSDNAPRVIAGKFAYPRLLSGPPSRLKNRFGIG